MLLPASFKKVQINVAGSLLTVTADGLQAIFDFSSNYAVVVNQLKGFQPEILEEKYTVKL